MIVAKRNENGHILVKMKGDRRLIFIRKAVKIADDFRMNVYFFMNINTRSCYWVMDKIQITLLSDSTSVKNGIVKRTGDGRGSQVKCRYHHPVIIAIHDWANGPNAQLFDADGYYLSGSNVHGAQNDNKLCYNLCLGVVPDLFSVDMVDALLFGKANNDLGWRGAAVTGESAWAKDQEGKRIKIFNMATWPTIERCRTIIPKEILDCANALKKSSGPEK
jgi:hypothetical protein